MSLESDTHAEKIEYIKAALPQWKNIETGLVKFQRLSGFTNVTYRVVDLEGKRAPLIFKKFSVVEGLLERQYQNRIMMQGSLKGIGPKVYFADNNFRIEQNLEGTTHPSNEDLQGRYLLLRIITKISLFHQLELEAIQDIIPFSEYILSSKYAKKAKKAILTKSFNEEEQKVVDKIMDYLQEDKLAELRKKLTPRQPDTVKLCHNDLNNLNIMLNENQTYLIDYEYSRYNHIAYDIANFLNESSINYTQQTFPFFKFQDHLVPAQDTVEFVCKAYLTITKGVDSPDPEQIRALVQDVGRCTALCNFYWAVWSPMTKNSEIDFGYLEHGLKRLERFQDALEKIESLGK